MKVIFTTCLHQCNSFKSSEGIDLDESLHFITLCQSNILLKVQKVSKQHHFYYEADILHEHVNPYVIKGQLNTKNVSVDFQSKTKGHIRTATTDHYMNFIRNMLLL